MIKLNVHEAKTHLSEHLERLERGEEDVVVIFEHSWVKTELKCDTYWVDLSVAAPLYHVDQTRYWFGLFSHRRASQQWKGMLQLPLGSLAEDREAASLLRLQDDSED